jgi:hypothetical protein
VVSSCVSVSAITLYLKFVPAILKFLLGQVTLDAPDDCIYELQHTAGDEEDSQGGPQRGVILLVL